MKIKSRVGVILRLPKKLRFMRNLSKRFILRVSVILILVSGLGCKENQGAKKISTEEKKIEIEKELIIDLEFKTSKSDVIVISLNEIEVDDFQKKSIQITENVEATSNVDRLTAKFGVGNISRRLTIDLGSKEIKEFEIVSIQFTYGENSINIAPDDIETYFALSKFTEFDDNTNKILTKEVDGYHYPKLYLRGVLWDQLII